MADRRAPSDATSQAALVQRSCFGDRKNLHKYPCVSCALGTWVLLMSLMSVFLPHGLCGFTTMCLHRDCCDCCFSRRPHPSFPVYSLLRSGTLSTESKFGIWGSFWFSAFLFFFSSLRVSYSHELWLHFSLPLLLLSFLLSSSSLPTGHGLTALSIIAIFLFSLLFVGACAEQPT